VLPADEMRLLLFYISVLLVCCYDVEAVRALCLYQVHCMSSDVTGIDCWWILCCKVFN